MTPQETARRIIHANNYLTLATTDHTGHPWASPVYFTPDSGIDFYWVSRPDSRHSLNLTTRPEVAIVIFNSQLPVFHAEAVYLTAHAEQVNDGDLPHCTALYRRRHPDLTTFTPEHLQAPNLLRLYRARAVEASVLLDDDGPDSRVPLALPI
ncbi:pyridoxamine 5'-phosphate oxidase family protein [Kribbella sp. NPDC051718]|uniref:pyridoxamine 5'-phosphate oxidase family protein n=1 Tax=Kribbella sp. NPDC051718 TaxID=3155168 RepID=UPI003447D9BD